MNLSRPQALISCIAFQINKKGVKVSQMNQEKKKPQIHWNLPEGSG